MPQGIEFFSGYPSSFKTSEPRSKLAGHILHSISIQDLTKKVIFSNGIRINCKNLLFIFSYSCVDAEACHKLALPIYAAFQLGA